MTFLRSTHMLQIAICDDEQDTVQENKKQRKNAFVSVKQPGKS